MNDHFSFLVTFPSSQGRDTTTAFTPITVGPVVEMRQTLRVVTARDLFTSSVVLLCLPYKWSEWRQTGPPYPRRQESLIDH